MGLIDRLISQNSQGVIGAAELPPDDDRYYSRNGAVSLTGERITPDQAMRISTVYRCVAAIADDIAAMPLLLYRRLQPEGKERATENPLYEILHDDPNATQTAFEWRETMMTHVLLNGNGYSEIKTLTNGVVESLEVPLDPLRMKVEKLTTGQLRYTYSETTGQARVFRPDQVLHLRGLGSNGITGMSIVTYARNSMGLGLAAESYGARYFSQDSTPGGVLQMEGNMTPDAGQRLVRNWERAHTGLGTAHRVALLERGVKWQQTGISNEDSQFLETRSFQIEEIARWFGVPLHRIGHNEKSTSWGTGIEQFNLGYIQYTLMPWMKRWEQRIRKDLVLQPELYFTEFLLDHLLRGDQQARYTSYQSAINTGWMARNEVRVRENLNPVEGLDEFLVPLSMGLEGNMAADANGESLEGVQATPGSGGAQGGSQAHWQNMARGLALDGAGRVVRKEVAAIQKAAKRFESDLDGLAAWVRDFYDTLEGQLIETLHLSPLDAAEYVVLQRDAVLHGGLQAVGTWGGQQEEYLAECMVTQNQDSGVLNGTA